MKKTSGWILWLILLGLCLSVFGFAIAGEVPSPTVSEFSNLVDPPWWMSFFGDLTPISAAIMAVLAAGYLVARPYLLTWLANMQSQVKWVNLMSIYSVIETIVGGARATIVKEVKSRVDSNGKMPKEDALYIKNLVKQEIIATLSTQGKDVVKEFGDAFLDWAIERILEKIKTEEQTPAALRSILGAVMPPLPELGSSQQPTK